MSPLQLLTLMVVFIHLVRNIYVRAGVSTILPTPEMQVELIAVPPVGLHRVRASFTPNPTDGRVIYRNTRGAEVWTQSIVTEITPYPENSRDIVENRFAYPA